MSHSERGLPEQPTTFVGREAELAEILSLLGDERCRLLTLVGPGGIGKSRLALKAAETLAQQRTGGAISEPWDGICFVPFQSVASPDQVASTIASALDWKTYEGNNPEGELQAYLAGKHVLLVLDNFEHLLPAAPLLLEILHSAPDCKLLITSRVTLNLAEEWLFQIGGMSLPPSDGNVETGTSDAVALFVERARRVRHDFSLEKDSVHVARICRFVEGMPLAIELAAAWLRRLSCAEVAAELDRGLDILASDQVGIPERHRGMEVVFDHSWNLLTLEERAAFMGLSVFRGGFTREAAEHVVGSSLPILSSLVDKSLLRLTASGRYAIHELQRQYAAERLAEAPDLLAKVTDEHSAYYLKLVARPARLRLVQNDRQLLKQFEDAIDNILAAWIWAVDHGRLADLRNAIDALYWFAWLSAYHQEINAAFQYAAETLSGDTADSDGRLVYASVMATLGSMDIWMGGMPEATERLPKMIAILRELQHAEPELGFAVGVLGWHMLRRLELETAKTLFLEAVQFDREAEQPEILGFIYCQLGTVYAMQSLYHESKQWYLQALTLGRSIEDHRTVTDALRELGKLALIHGEYAKADQYLDEALQLAESKDLLSFTVSVLYSLGELAEATGDLEAASHLVEQSLDASALWGKGSVGAAGAIALANVRTDQGDYAAGRALQERAAPIVHRARNHFTEIAYLNSVGRLALSCGDYETARRSYVDLLELSGQHGDRQMSAQAHIGQGLALLRQDDYAGARTQLLAGLAEARSIELLPILLFGVAAAAEFYAATGDCAYAAQLAAVVRHHVASAATTKQQANSVLAQVTQQLAPEFRERIEQHGASADIEAVARRLVAELSREDKALVNQTSDTQLLVEPLSQRELQVLRLVADGKSNREIGRELFLALGTVKSHLNHIFQKLDVQSRTQAVARALELRIL